MGGHKKGEQLYILPLRSFWICACYAPTLSCPHSHGMDFSATIAPLVVTTITPSTPTPVSDYDIPAQPPITAITPESVTHTACAPCGFPSNTTFPTTQPPPPKFAPAHVPSPPLASGSDPLTPRTEQLLRLPLPELDSRVDMGWSRYAFALRHHGQVQMWQRG